MHAERKSRLKKQIETSAFVSAKDKAIVTPHGRQKHSGWLFDLRNILLKPDVLEDAGALFLQTFGKTLPFQIGGVETAAIPLVTGLVTHVAREKKGGVVSGFFFRKSRKKDGLMRMIEGELVQDRPIILVDDLINSGKSLMRQVESLAALGHRVHAIWVLVRFRDIEQYSYFTERGIRIESVFTLDDFTKSLGTKNLLRKDAPLSRHDAFRTVWKFSAGHPNFHHVVSKSNPVVDDKRLYVGSDDGTMWALDQENGSVVWSHKIGSHTHGKGIFSSPTVHEGVVFFGGYDGNMYALDAASGKKKWVAFEADWIGSSPAVAADLGMIFVGLEFGLWRKRGGIAAFDVRTGKTIWRMAEMPCLTHSSPLYIKSRQQVVIGSNDGAAYLFEAQTGALVWKYEPASLTEIELNTGFSAYDIKGSFAYDATTDAIIFANKNGSVIFLDRSSGALRFEFKAEFGFYSTPVIEGRTVLAASLDKYLYCIDLDAHTLLWKWYAGARIFSTPAIIEKNIFIGANTGRMTELDPKTGKEISFVPFPERITNTIAYNPKTGRFFVPTFANEIYCLERAAIPKQD